jgi:radical SAM protein with 4Fe4S-binding SPASM domain
MLLLGWKKNNHTFTHQMNLKDSINFLSKLNFKRVWNATKVYASFKYSGYVNKPIQWGKPFNVSIEPTTECNLGCPECPSGLKSFSRPTGKMDVALFTKFLDQSSDVLLYLYFYFQGEPYLHPKFLEMVKMAKKKKIYTVTSTNAHFLTERKAKETIESGLDRILVSVDGTTQEVYENYRKNGSLEKVKKGIANLVKAKKELKSNTPHIILQFLVVKPNEHQIEDVKILGEELGVDEVAFKTAQIYDFENGSDLMPTIDKYSRYKKTEDGKYKIKNKMKNQCWKLWHSNVVTWDGDITPCCFDKDADHTLGNINDDSVEDIWQNGKYQNFRKQILKDRKSIDICKNCSEGLKVFS